MVSTPQSSTPIGRPVAADSIDNSHRQHLHALVRQERTPAYRRKDYLSHDWQLALWPQSRAARQSPSSVIIPNDGSCSVPQATLCEICVGWREQIVQWKYRVIDGFDLDREIVSVSTFYLDQYLSVHYVVDVEELLQLAAMTSIFLAIKIHSPKKVTARCIASTGTSDLITAKHIEAMELSMMTCLDWHLFPPTAAALIENFIPLLSTECNESKIPNKMSDTLEFATFLAELSVCAYPFASAKPSSVAVAAMLYGFEYYGHPKETRDAFKILAEDLSLTVNDPEVESCGRLLRLMFQEAMSNYDAKATL